MLFYFLIVSFKRYIVEASNQRTLRDATLNEHTLQSYL